MIWTILISAVAIVFVFEGIMPFLCPECYRKIMRKLIAKHDTALRLMGFFSMAFGVVVLFIVHHHLL